MSSPRCWGYRIATDHIEYFAEQLDQGRLRQGWGYDERQNLLDLTFDGGAGRNLRMLDVQEGDLLLIPRLPEWSQVAIVEATADWRNGYRFRIDPDMGDFGHVFPARRLTSFVRDNEHVAGDIRATLRNPSRFWNIDHLSSDIQRLVETTADLGTSKTPLARARHLTTGVFREVLNEGDFKGKIYNRLNERLEGKDWEQVLEAVMSMRYPTGDVRIVQGTSEAHHGTDILVKLPDVTGESRYAIAIQVKDHVGTVSDEAVEQLRRANYWEKEHGLQLIQRVVVFTRATRKDNEHLVELEKKEGDLQIVFGEVLHRMLEEWSLSTAKTLL